MRPQRHAVAHPRTVMVHAHHTLVADRAVVSTRRLWLPTLVAVTPVKEVVAITRPDDDELIVK